MVSMSCESECFETLPVYYCRVHAPPYRADHGLGPHATFTRVSQWQRRKRSVSCHVVWSALSTRPRSAQRDRQQWQNAHCRYAYHATDIAYVQHAKRGGRGNSPRRDIQATSNSSRIGSRKGQWRMFRGVTPSIFNQTPHVEGQPSDIW